MTDVEAVPVVIMGPHGGLSMKAGLLRVPSSKQVMEEVYLPPTVHAGCAPVPPRAASRSSKAAPAKCPHLSPVSRLFLGMGDATPDIYATLWLRGCATLEEIVWVMETMTAAHDRFRMRIVPRGAEWCTEILEEFDVRWCMRELTLPGDDVEQAFNDFVARLMSGAPLTEGPLPPWDCSVVHFAADPTRTVVLLRCSHMIGDGQLFMQLLQDVVQEVDEDEEGLKSGGGGGGGSDAIVVNCEPSDEAEASASSFDASLFAAGASERDASSEGGGGGGGGGPGSDGGASGSGGACEQSGGSTEEGEGGPTLIRAVRTRSAFLPPPSLERATKGRAKKQQHKVIAKRRQPFLVRPFLMLWDTFTSALFVLTLPFRVPDPRNAIKAGAGDCVGPRAFASVTLPMDDMRRAGDLLGVTINALAVSCIAGGLRRHLQRSPGGGGARSWWRLGRATEGVPDQLLLCSMVDTRAMRRDGEQRGCNTMSFIGVPVNTADVPPLRRLGAVADSLKWIRNAFALFMAVLMPPLVQFLVRDAGLAARVILFILPSKTTLGFSNMRGPQGRVQMCGHMVERLYNGVQPNAFGSFISLMSYNKEVTLVHSCWEAKSPHPEELLQCIREEWDALHAAVTALQRLQADSSTAPGASKRLAV